MKSHSARMGSTPSTLTAKAYLNTKRECRVPTISLLRFGFARRFDRQLFRPTSTRKGIASAVPTKPASQTPTSLPQAGVQRSETTDSPSCTWPLNLGRGKRKAR